MQQITTTKKKNGSKRNKLLAHMKLHDYSILVTVEQIMTTNEQKFGVEEQITHTSAKHYFIPNAINHEYMENKIPDQVKPNFSTFRTNRDF